SRGPLARSVRGRGPRRDPRQLLPLHGLPVHRRVRARRCRRDARRSVVIPAPFEYERPASLDAALRSLAASGGSARAIAGGQSLLPLMKLRLARPERLVDIGRFDELRGVRRLDTGGLAIGSMTIWAALLEDPSVAAY